MAKRTPVQFNTGVGRFIGGSCYTGNDKDDKGLPKLYKTGAKAGQPRTDYSVGIALPKVAGQHWASTPWGAVIWAEGHGAWPQGQAQRKDFAWKIIDGDSTEPNKKMKRPCDQVGYPGHWVLWFGGTNPPPVAVAVTGAPVWNDTPGTCMPGDYIEIRGSVVSNESTETAGVYLNPDAVCLRGYHPDGRISQALPDLATAGFGAALPAGAVMQPAGNVMAPPVPGSAPGVTSPTATAPAAPPAAAPSPSVAQPSAQVPVVPNPAILGAPAPVGVPSVPVPSPVAPTPPAPVGPVMLPKAAGATYESFIGAGWTPAAMIAEGYMAP